MSLPLPSIYFTPVFQKDLVTGLKGGGAKGNIGPGSTREEGVDYCSVKCSLLLEDGKIGMRYDGIECVGVGFVACVWEKGGVLEIVEWLSRE
ncbi:hypothetical protein CDAR_309791 [Caerostris darwini]|uniref:Uncharacterized protein n=1 Tax=Caerostris darwini TaxID=1538125 RepID=A0AAV4VX41_9ARAC|nr:hypothetical protein CDAR_309791 [Caerostris darwini]